MDELINTGYTNAGRKNGHVDEYDGLALPKDAEQKILRTFIEKSAAADKWINDLVNNGYSLGKKIGRRVVDEQGFFMSDEMQQVGVLSVAPALSALLSELELLYDDDNVKAEDNPFKKKLAEKPIPNSDKSVLSIVVDSIGKLLYECYPSGVNGYSDNIENVLFSSLPFFDEKTLEDTSGWENGGYLDAASWVFLAADCIEKFLNNLERVAPEIYKNQKWKAGGQEYTEQLTSDEVKKAVRNMYLSSVQVTCDCIVRSGDEENGRVLGWSFRPIKRGAEPSLYFSYVASTVYLGLHKRFDGGDGKIQKLREFENQLVSIAENLRSSGLQSDFDLADEVEKFAFFKDITDANSFKKKLAWLNQKKFDKYEEFKNFAQYLKGLSEEDKIELDILYNQINKGQPLTYRFDENFDEFGCFTLLKNSSVSLAEMLWNEGFGATPNKLPFKKHMAKGPCFQDGTPVDLSVVRQSNHNNSFFNNLFVIGIVINSAYDEALKVKDPEEYVKMLNAFQLSIQNTQRCYDEIEDEGFLYKIDSYILEFAEKVDSRSTELSKQLRKVNMAVLPLMPLLLKNNNLMNEYLVQYPQKEMKDSLKAIIRNKKCNKEKQRIWVWDKDGYNAITNYYYVDALIAFYRYYETYEAKLINNEIFLNKAVNKAVAATAAEKEEQIRILETEHEKEITKKKAELDEMHSVLRGLARLVLNEMIDLVDEQLSPDKLIGNLSDAEKKNRDLVADTINTSDKGNYGVKVGKLVHITEKLQLLSLLTMKYDNSVEKILKSGLPGNLTDTPENIVNVMEKNGGSSDFLRKLILALAKNNILGNGSTDEKN